MGNAPPSWHRSELTREHRGASRRPPSFSAGVKTVLCFLQVFLLKRRVACLTQACVQTVCLPHLTLVCTQTRGFFPSNGNLAFTASFRGVWSRSHAAATTVLTPERFHLPQKKLPPHQPSQAPDTLSPAWAPLLWTFLMSGVTLCSLPCLAASPERGVQARPSPLPWLSRLLCCIAFAR